MLHQRMAARVFCWMVAASLLAGCSGGGTENPPDVVGASQSVDEGTVSLQSGDVAAAQAKFDDAVTKNASDSKALFGSAFTRILLLAESVPGMALQKGLRLHNGSGGAQFTLSDCIGPSGYLAALAAFHRKAGPSPSLTKFPLSGLENIKAGRENLWGPRILAFTPTGFTMAEVQSKLKDFEPLYEIIISELSSAKEDASFQFTIPKELFSGDRDIQVGRTDLLLLLGGMQLLRASMSFANAWNFDIDLGMLYHEDGTQRIATADLLPALNKFFVLKDSSQLSDGKAFLSNGISTLLTALQNAPTSDVFGIVEKDSTTAAAFSSLQDVVTAIQQSFGTSTSIPTTIPTTTLDLNRFFSDPPDASKIDIDPFVLENGRIRLVESFFNQLIQKALNVSVSQSAFSIFSGKVNRAFARSVFNEFIPFTIGGKPVGE